jgi:hypothetical protein
MPGEIIWQILEDKFYTICFLCIGIFGFFWGFTRLRRKRMVENIPTSTVRGLALGLTELVGKAEGLAKGPLYVTPLSGLPCAYYRYLIERFVRRGRNSYWETVMEGDSTAHPFWLSDDTGRIMVFPKGAEMMIDARFNYYERIGVELPPEIVAFTERYHLRRRGLLGAYTLRFREWYILDDEQVYVLGTAKKTQNVMPGHKEQLMKRIRELKADPQKMAAVDLDQDGEISSEEWDRAVAQIENELLEKSLEATKSAEPSDVVMAQGDVDTVYIISNTSQRKVLEDLTIEIALGIFGGSLMALIALWSLVDYLRLCF